MFDPGVIPLGDGRLVDLGSWERLRYAGLLVRIGFHSPLSVVIDSAKANGICDEFERQEQRVRELAQARAAVSVGAGMHKDVVEAVAKLWLHACRDCGMTGDVK
jgi:hypothetical protein